MPWEWPVGAVCAFVLALVTTPAGVSGAVLLLPIQLSVLHVPSPAVTPTNLLFNVAAVPGGLLRFWHERRLLNRLTWLLISGTLPGVVAGAIIRVELLSGGRAVELVAAGVLLPLGLWLAVGSQRLAPAAPKLTRRGRCGIWFLSLVVGTVGGIYGIGGGSILAPILLALGYSAFEVAPATFAATFLTSVGGIVDLPAAAGRPWRCDRTGLGAGGVSRRRRVCWPLPRCPAAAPPARTHVATPPRPDRVPRGGPVRPDQHQPAASPPRLRTPRQPDDIKSHGSAASLGARRPVERLGLSR